MACLITEGMHSSGLSLLKKAEIKVYDITHDIFDSNEVSVIIVRSVFRINAALLKKFPNLKIVAKLGTGLDNVDLSLCKKKNILVINTPGINAVSTAEFTVTHILSIYKNLYNILKNVENKDYRRHLYYGREIAGSTVGIIGYGSVGRNIAERMKPFVKKIFISDNGKKIDLDVDKFSFVADLKTLLSSSDIVIFSVSFADNCGLVDQEFLSLLKKDVLLVNTARGAIINEKDLTTFLKKNKKAFYYCDVLEKEPDYAKMPDDQDFQNPLLDLDNVIFTPHIAGMTKECQKQISLVIAKKIIGTFK